MDIYLGDDMYARPGYGGLVVLVHGLAGGGNGTVLATLGADQLRVALAVAEGRDPDPKQEQISVLRLIEYRGTREWVESTLNSKGALIPGGTGNWGGRITSTLLDDKELTLANKMVPSTRASNPNMVEADGRD